MNHLFYLHSNITCLSSYEMIFNLQKRGEEVTIILSRNLKWPFSLKVNRIVNISRMNFFLHTKVDKIRSLRSYILALYCKKRMKNYINSIVGEDDYIAYIPNYKSMIISNLCERKQCKGYYYIEEGTLSYFSIDYAKKVMHYSNFFKLLSVVLMVNYDFALKQTKKFKGTISINESAFPWNNKQKIITSLDAVNLNCVQIIEKKMDIIILPSLIHPTEVYMEIIDRLLLRIENRNLVALKFHPKSSNRENQKFAELIHYLDYKGIQILPDYFIVEFNLKQYKSNIYSIIEKSSLLLYSLLLGGKSYWVKCEGGIVVVEEKKSIYEIV